MRKVRMLLMVSPVAEASRNVREQVHMEYVADHGSWSALSIFKASSGVCVHAPNVILYSSHRRVTVSSTQ